MRKLKAVLTCALRMKREKEKQQQQSTTHGNSCVVGDRGNGCFDLGKHGNVRRGKRAREHCPNAGETAE